MKQLKTIIPLVLVLFFTWPCASQAHKVSIFAWVEDGRVYTQSKFSGGKKVVNGKVEVFDNQENRLLEGSTDENGEFSFTTPAATDLNIVLTAGMGHKNSWKLAADEISGSLPEKAASNPLQSDSENKKGTPSDSGYGHTGQSAVPCKAPSLSAEDVETIVSRQLENKLKPLTRMLAAEQNKGPGISEIIGGIGYILGLVGIGAYIRFRKEGRRS